MKTKLLALVLSAVLTLPCIVRAEEVEILLTEVVEMTPLPGDNPLDSPEQSPSTHPCSSCFRATIDGTTLAINKREASIPSAQAMVVNASTGGVVLNQSFTNSLLEQITTSGIYILRIHTTGGDLVGQFLVQ